MNALLAPTDTAQALYAAFGRGDIAAIIDHLRPDVDWHVNLDASAPGVSGVVMFRPRRGRDQVRQFFSDLSSSIEFHSFEPRSFMAGASEVAVHVAMEFTVRSTGKRLQMEAIHHWTFDAAGNVARFVDYLDTLGEAAAWGVVQPAAAGRR